MFFISLTLKIKGFCHDAHIRIMHLSENFPLLCSCQSNTNQAFVDIFSLLVQ